MKKIIRSLPGLLLAVVLPAAAWAQLPSRYSATFESLDVDGNQQIDREEAREEPRLSIQFSTFDTDGDGRISRREYQRFLGPNPRPRLPL